ncbi:MAG: SMP-30/gluconolactonase/LRE family protein [Planctomycetota bacterium]|jgi:sugar lactone lactonase YvrE
MKLVPKVLLDGLIFPEAPRWHDGRLFFSDMLAGRVMTVDMDGNSEVVVEVPGQPSGLGWLPDGRMLVVSMTDRRLLRLDPDELLVVADLRQLATFHCNDMVVDGQGRAYIGNFGFDLIAQQSFSPAEIVLVTPDGQARVVATDMAFPNGTVITPDGTLIIAETFAARLTAFDIEADGSLTKRREWARLEGAFPDGICLDAEGAIWFASPEGRSGVMRVCEGGKVTHHIKVSTKAYACMLGGPDGRTLFVLTAETISPAGARAKASGRIETVRVEIPGAGLP